MSQSDQAFVAASWFESYWKGYAKDDRVSFARYKHEQDKLIKYRMGRSTINVAFAEATPDEIVGYIVFEHTVMHYVYVKSPYRRMGVASGLVEGHGILQYTHRLNSKACAALLRDKEYNPYLRTA